MCAVALDLLPERQHDSTSQKFCQLLLVAADTAAAGAAAEKKGHESMRCALHNAVTAT